MFVNCQVEIQRMLRFLIDDNLIFDCLYERRIVHVLELVARDSVSAKFQYNVSLNSAWVSYEDFKAGLGKSLKTWWFTDATKDDDDLLCSEAGRIRQEELP